MGKNLEKSEKNRARKEYTNKKEILNTQLIKYQANDKHSIQNKRKQILLEKEYAWFIQNKYNKYVYNI